MGTVHAGWALVPVVPGAEPWAPCSSPQDSVDLDFPSKNVFLQTVF